jgi:hypothetical protein
MRWCLALLIVGLVALDERQAASIVGGAERPELPRNIVVPHSLTGLAVEMLEGSRTFRRQCERLGMHRQLHVRITLDLETRWSGRRVCDAKGKITRYQFGRVEADVRLLTVRNVESLIAHELEHVREYVEGVNFLATSIQHPRRVWLTPEGHYETTRAIDVGDQVADELSRHRSRQSTATLAHREQ